MPSLIVTAEVTTKGELPLDVVGVVIAAIRDVAQIQIQFVLNPISFTCCPICSLCDS